MSGLRSSSGTRRRTRLLREFRVRMLEEAADAGLDLIVTWAHPRNAEEGARAYFEAVDSRGGCVCVS